MLSPAVKKAARERDGYKCTRCGSTDNLEIHHISFGDTIDNVTTLCHTCHRDNHPYIGSAKTCLSLSPEIKRRVQSYMIKRNYRLNKFSYSIVELIEKALDAEGI